MHHPSDDRRIGGGAVIAAWALVGALVAAMAFGSVLAKSAPPPNPQTAQVHAESHSLD